MELFGNEDFCLLKDFPFKQLVFLNFVNFYSSPNPMLIFATENCVFMWMLISYRNFYSEKQFKEIFYFHTDGRNKVDWNFSNELISNCNLKNRLDLCNKMSSTISNKYDLEWKTFDTVNLLNTMRPILSLVLSLVAIPANICIIVVIFHKKNQKNLKEKHYKYMTITCCINILILLIECLTLMNYCDEFEIVCSKIVLNLAVQFYKIIFTQFFAHVFRLLSNFTFLAFALNRLSLIGKDHDCLTNAVSNMKIKNYLGISGLVSLLFSVVKIFLFEPNYSFPLLPYPIDFQDNPSQIPSQSKIISIKVLNAITNMLNYVLFGIINLIIDINLIRKMKQTMKEQEEKLKEQISKKALETRIKENRESVDRTVKMSVLYALVNLAFKMPASIISLHDMLLVIFYKPETIGLTDEIELYTFEYFFKYICSFSQICMTMNNYGDFLHLISLSTSILFFYKFDKKISFAFKEVFCSFRKKQKQLERKQEVLDFTFGV